LNGKLKILAVDDELMILNAIEECLSRKGREVLTASDAAVGV
jgi:DNA-binding response OmpR family regulator